MSPCQPTTIKPGTAMAASILTQNFVPIHPARQLAVAAAMNRNVYSTKKPRHATNSSQVRK